MLTYADVCSRMQDAEPELEAESSQDLAPGAQEGEGGAGGGTQFTCFTGTKVQLLTLTAGQALSLLALLVLKYKY
jgi:hypothetical protein